MRVRAWTDLILVNVAVLLLITAILAFPSNILRIVLGVPFILFFPGYVLMATLFTRKASMENMQRIALSLGTSIAIVPIIGLILNLTPWGITLESVLSSTTAFIVVMSAVAWVRRKQLPKEERFGLELRMSVPGWSGNVWDRALMVLLTISVLGALTAVGYAVAVPKDEEKFTEFYILGRYGEAADYPENVIVGTDIEVTACIINHNTEAVNYRLIITLEDSQVSEVGPIAIPAGDTWEQAVSFIPDKLGENQKVSLLLYEQGKTEPFQTPLSFHIDVIE